MAVTLSFLHLFSWFQANVPVFWGHGRRLSDPASKKGLNLHWLCKLKLNDRKPIVSWQRLKLLSVLRKLYVYGSRSDQIRGLPIVTMQGKFEMFISIFASQLSLGISASLFRDQCPRLKVKHWSVTCDSSSEVQQATYFSCASTFRQNGDELSYYRHFLCLIAASRLMCSMTILVTSLTRGQTLNVT